MRRLKLIVTVSLFSFGLLATPAQADPLRDWFGGLVDWGKRRPTAAVTVSGFVPPTRGLPSNREGGSARGGLCPASPQRLTALVPSSSLGLTVAARPSFFVYLPPTGNRPVELMLQDAQGKVLHVSEFQPKHTGIVRVDLPSHAPELAVGQTYRWYFSIICDPNDSSASLHVGGWVQRIPFGDSLRQQLAKAPVSDRPYLYAKAGLWHETLAAFLELRQAQPANPHLQSDWLSLLQLQGLEQLAQAPVAGNL
ncbi:MAG: DUF928 domain-containing protein [Gloeomargarita sp. DG02_3_bins_56]